MNKEIYQKYFKQNKKGLVLLILTIGIGAIISGINPYIYGKIVDSISEKDIYSLKKGLLFFGSFLIITLLLEAVESLIGSWLTYITENQMKVDLFEYVTFIDCKKLDIYEEGELFNKIEFDTENIVGYYIDCITSILMIFFNLVISVYFILNISKKLTIITFIMMPVLYVVNLIFRKRVYTINQKIRNFTDNYYNFLNDSLSELIEIVVNLNFYLSNYKSLCLKI